MARQSSAVAGAAAAATAGARHAGTNGLASAGSPAMRVCMHALNSSMRRGSAGSSGLPFAAAAAFGARSMPQQVRLQLDS